MLLRALYVPVNFPAGPSPDGPQALETPLHPVGPKLPVTIVPSFFSLMCSQARCLHPRGRPPIRQRAGARIPGGVWRTRNPRTPASIRYYLDPAHFCRAAGAHSAAVAMYRAALEHLLFDQRYRNRSLGAKIKQLEAALADETAPRVGERPGSGVSKGDQGPRECRHPLQRWRRRFEEKRPQQRPRSRSGCALRQPARQSRLSVAPRLWGKSETGRPRRPAWRPSTAARSPGSMRPE
jgi:hypothetical protein